MLYHLISLKVSTKGSAKSTAYFSKLQSARPQDTEGLEAFFEDLHPKLIFCELFTNVDLFVREDGNFVNCVGTRTSGDFVIQQRKTP